MYAQPAIIAPECTAHTQDDGEKIEFLFAELSDTAKDFAREDRRDCNVSHDWWGSIYDDVQKIAQIFGINIKTTGSPASPCIYFSGFSSQGDGACFEGWWQPVKDPVALLNKILAHAPLDEKLHDIALDFAELSQRHGMCCDENGEVVVSLIHRGNYSHSHSIVFETEFTMPYGSDDWNDFQLITWEAVQRAKGMDTFENDVITACRSLMDWLYRQLEAEHDYLTSDDCIDEYLAGLTFNEDGETIA